MATSGNDKYAITSAQGVIQRLGEILTDINLRLVQAESRYDTTDRAAQEVASQGLRYLETVIVPAATKVADLLLSLSDLFETTSKSSVKISDPLVTFQVDPSDSNTFATLGYVIASAVGSTSGLGGPVVSFDPKSGVLVLDPDFTWGSGTFSDWKLIGSPPVGAIVAATDPVLASRAQAIGNTIVADATARIAAAQAQVQAVADGRVSKAGDTMSGPFFIAYGDAALSLKLVGGPHDKRAWRFNNYGGDACLYFQAVEADSSVSNAVSFNRYGAIYTSQLGDLRSYIDQAPRTDQAQNFNATQRARARKNMGADGSDYRYAAQSLTSSDAGLTVFLDGSSASTFTLPNIGQGEVIELYNSDTVARTVNPLAGGNIFSEGGGGSTAVTLAPYEVARFRKIDGNNYLHFRGVPLRSTLNADKDQTFNDAQKQRLYSNADLAIPHGQCRLQYVDPTTLCLIPYNGNKLFINGNYRTIPVAGVTVSNAGLSANTLYYVFSYWDAGTGQIKMAIGIGAPKVDPVFGHKVTNSQGSDAGNRMFSLVGMIYTDAAGKFFQDGATQFVLSWYNRVRTVLGSNITINGGTNANQFIQAGRYMYGLFWDASAVLVSVLGYASAAAGGAQLQCCVRMENNTSWSGATVGTGYAAGAIVPSSFSMGGYMSEGLHGFSPYILGNGGGGNFVLDQYVSLER